MSDRIFACLKAKKVPCRIKVVHSSLASSGTHRFVQYKSGSTWKNFDYTGFHKWLGPSSGKFIKYLKTYNGG